MKSRSWLSLLLYLVALHSFLVGLALIILPFPMLDFFGFKDYQGDFFKAQGGVFHIVMSVVYVIAARNFDKHKVLIYITLMAKFTATIFLLGYYFIIEHTWMVLVSGIGDFLMGLFVFLLWRQYRRYIKNSSNHRSL